MGAQHKSGSLAAILVLASLSAQAAGRPVRLQVLPEVAKGVAAMPRILEPADEAERRINTALQRLDAKVGKAATECRNEGGSSSWWERNIDATMRGPRYLSFEIVDSVFCGGAHPNASTMAIVYDLTTGDPVDWTSLLPASLTGKVALQTGADGTRMVTLASKRLHALYLKGYRPRTDRRKPDEADVECRDAVTNTGSAQPPPMMAWLDAKKGGLAVQFDLPHAVQACAEAVVISTATLRQEGAQSTLTDAVDTAHAKRQLP